MKTVEAFKNYVQKVHTQKGYANPKAFAIGVVRKKNNRILDAYFPLINWEGSFGTAAVLHDVLKVKSGSNQFYGINKKQLEKIFNSFEAFHHEIDKHLNVSLIQSLFKNFGSKHSYYETEIGAYFLYDDKQDVQDAVEGYFKLQSISQRHVLPHGLNLTGIFGKLNNVAWTNIGPVFPEDLSAIITQHIFTNPITVSHVDKFPYLVNYHVPSGVRIASGSQVRLGAYLGEGTTVMPAGYINFNAGTKGNAMVEGRVSGGVVVDKNSDIGGGASIMGTLSGGNKNVISIGKECLLGANSGTGISLGDGCTIAAGVYVTAGAKVSYYNRKNEPINAAGKVVKEGQNLVKAMDLSGQNNLLFMNDSVTGRLICKPNPKTIELNEALHVNV